MATDELDGRGPAASHRVFRSLGAEERVDWIPVRAGPPRSPSETWEANPACQAWSKWYPAAPQGAIIALGKALEERLGMRPFWTRPKAVLYWMLGLMDVLAEAKGDAELVLAVAMAAREKEVVITYPFALVARVREAMALERMAAKRALAATYARKRLRSPAHVRKPLGRLARRTR